MHLSKPWFPGNRPSAALLGPGADEAFAPLASPEIRWRVRLAYAQHWIRRSFQERVGLAADRMLFRRWMQATPDSRCIEALGLPRRSVEAALGEDVLTLHVDPRKLIRIAANRPQAAGSRPPSVSFIWDGDWDLRREDLRCGTRYRMISELDENRNDLSRSNIYQELMADLERGAPWSSHQEGILLNTPAKICRYLQVYLDYLDGMAAHGFDASRGKDPLGVAISREGRILKVNRGLHRLAMAQRLGLPAVPVRVRCVHRAWWNQVVQGATGQAALDRVRLALRNCMPEELAGPLDTEEPATQDFAWPPVLRGKI